MNNNLANQPITFTSASIIKMLLMLELITNLRGLIILI